MTWQQQVLSKFLYIMDRSVAGITHVSRVTRRRWRGTWVHQDRGKLLIFSGSGMPMSPVFPFGTHTYVWHKNTHIFRYMRKITYIAKYANIIHEDRSVNKLQIGVVPLVFKVWTCKGDAPSQWSKFRLPRGGGSETTQPIHLKFRTFDYVRRSTTCRIRWPQQMGGGVGIWVKLYPRVFFRFFFHFYASFSACTALQRNLCSMRSKTRFGGGVVLWGRFAQGVKYLLLPKNGTIWPICAECAVKPQPTNLYP